MSRLGYYLVPNSVGEQALFTIRVVPNDVATLDDIILNVGRALSLSENRVKAVIAQAFAVAVEEAGNGKQVNFDLFHVKPRIPGSAEYIDAPFDPETQRVIIDAYFDGDNSVVFADTEPYRVDATEMASRIKVSNVTDVESETMGLIDGTKQFRITGNGMTLDASGEYAKLIDKKTGAVLATAEVDQLSKGQRALCHLPYVNIATGDYSLEVGTYGLVGDSALHVFRKAVHYIAGPAPVPAPTAAITGKTNFTISSSGYYTEGKLTGENFGDEALEGDGLWYKAFLTDGTTREGVVSQYDWSDTAIEHIKIAEEGMADWATPETIELTLKTHAGVEGSTQQTLTAELTAS